MGIRGHGSLGPTFVVHNKQTVHIRWHNQIQESETLPYRVVVFPNVLAQNDPGADDGVIDDAAGVFTASIVTHLHGGRTSPDSDGWAENVYRSGTSMNTTYGKAGLPDSEVQRALRLLWYHDHGMGVTRLNVYAGLFGFWVLRDEVESAAIEAGLLPDEDHELFLVVQDRNFDTNPDKTLSGAILHKTETATAEMFGPYTLVNGKLWPTTEVPACPMRIRILNGSNSRTYCLRLVEVGPNDANGRPTYGQDFGIDPGNAPFWQVGTDGGLLDYPVLPASFCPKDPTLPETDTNRSNRGLILAPAERVDLVIDFGSLVKKLTDQSSTGRKVAFINTAFALFHGSTITYTNKFNQDVPLSRKTCRRTRQKSRPPSGYLTQKLSNSRSDLTRPEHRRPLLPVMATASEGNLSCRNPADSHLSTPNFKRGYVHKTGTGGGRAEQVLPGDHEHRWIALDEDPVGNLTFRELAPYTTDPDIAARAPAGTPLIPIAEINGVVTWYSTMAKYFHDAARFFIKSGGCEIWKILNLTGDSHPVHVHLVQFQILSRQRYNASAYQTPPVIQVPPTSFAPLPPSRSRYHPTPTSRGSRIRSG